MSSSLIKKLRLLNFNLIYVDSCKSTNTMANTLMESKCIDNKTTIIIAENQTHGKGQLSTSWQSEDGKNLTFSIVLYHDALETENLFYLNIAVSLSIDKSLKNFNISDVKVKWPNDICVADKKICGILIESQIQKSKIHSSIIGIGLNVNQKALLPEKAASIASILNTEISKEDLLIDILEKIKIYYATLEDKNFELLRNLYINNLYWYNEFHLYKSSNKTFEGKIIDITKEGNLVLSLRDGYREGYGVKQIEFIS